MKADQAASGSGLFCKSSVFYFNNIYDMINYISYFYYEQYLLAAYFIQCYYSSKLFDKLPALLPYGLPGDLHHRVLGVQDPLLCVVPTNLLATKLSLKLTTTFWTPFTLFPRQMTPLTCPNFLKNSLMLMSLSQVPRLDQDLVGQGTGSEPRSLKFFGNITFFRDKFILGPLMCPVSYFGSTKSWYKPTKNILTLTAIFLA